MAESTVEKHEELLKKEDFFELIIDNRNRASPLLQFCWCVNKKGLEFLQTEKVLHPFLLVTVLENKSCFRTGWRDYERQLHPLDRGMGHIEFRYPGEYRVHASIVWILTKEFKEAYRGLHDIYLVKNSFGYETKLHDDMTYRPDCIRHDTLPYHDEIEIMVDKNLFAPEPPKWQKKWVNMFRNWNQRAKNQCEWRKHKAIAFTLQPLYVFFIWFPLRTLCAILIIAFYLLIGIYPNRIRWGVIIHPIRMKLSDLIDVYRIRKSCNYWWLAYSDKLERPMFERVLLNPVIIISTIITSLICFRNNFFFQVEVQNWNLLFFAFLSTVMVLSAILFVSHLFTFIIKISFGQWFQKMTNEHQKRKQEKYDKITWKREISFQKQLSFYYGERIQPLSCDNRLKKATIASLPKSHRTIQLRFLEKKTHLCKIFRG